MFSNLSKEKIFFTQHLYLMIKGGLSLSEALETLKEETKSKTFKKVLDDVLKRVLEGESLNQGLSRHPKIFNQFFQGIVKIGEESGNLEENLQYLNSQLRSEYEIKRKVTAALIYPLIVVVLAVVIAFFVSFFVLPKAMAIFQMFNFQLPLTTRILISVAKFLKRSWAPIIIVVIFLILLFQALKKIKIFRYLFDKFNLSLPIFGPVFKNVNLVQFSQSFSTILKSGISLLDAFDICVQNLPNEILKESLVSVKAEVEKGGKISQGLKNYPKVFPPIFSQMVSVGERSGSLEDSFLYLSQFYQEEIDSALKNVSTVLEPLLLILVGLFVGFVALAIITPIFQFTGSLRFR
jgi:type II secretory pathway component PulF